MLAVSLEAQLMLVFNSSFNNFVIRNQIIEHTFVDIKMVKDNIGLA